MSAPPGGLPRRPLSKPKTGVRVRFWQRKIPRCGNEVGGPTSAKTDQLQQGSFPRNGGSRTARAARGGGTRRTMLEKGTGVRSLGRQPAAAARPTFYLFLFFSLFSFFPPTCQVRRGCGGARARHMGSEWGNCEDPDVRRSYPVRREQQNGPRYFERVAGLGRRGVGR